VDQRKGLYFAELTLGKVAVKHGVNPAQNVPQAGFCY
jgi:hypothetical protein